MARIRLLSLVTPLADVPVEQRQAIVRGTMRILSREAQKIPSLRGDLAARMLAGNDLGLATHFWNETVSRTTGTANTYENSAINGTTARDRIIGIYGVYVASSWDTVGSLRFEVGAKRSHQWDLQGILVGESDPRSREQRTLVIYQGENSEALDPIIIPPNTTILVQHYVRGGSAVGIQPAELVFLGVVLEPVGGGGGGLQLLAGPERDMMEPGPRRRGPRDELN